MLPYIWKLLRARWRITWNNVWRAGRRRKIGLFFAALGISALSALLIFASWGLLSLLRRPELAKYVTPDVVRAVPVLFTSATFLAGLLTNFGVLLQSLYLAGDMEFLLAAPIPPRAVFVTKLIQAVLPNFMFMCLFNLPALLGLGLAQGYHLTYFVMLPVTLVLLMLAGAGISSVGVMLVVRLVPARRVAEVLGLVGGVTSILCSQSGQIMRATSVGRASSQQMASWINAAAQFDQPYSPLAWPGRALVALGEGQWLNALLLVGATVALTAGAFAVSLITAERLYISGWARTRAGAALRKAARRDAARGDAAPVVRQRVWTGVRFLPSSFTALVAKDFRLLTRDLRNFSQLITPIVFGVVYTFSLFGGQQRVGSPVEREFVAYGGLGTGLFVAWIFAARLGLGGIGMEGKRYWLLKVAPLRAEILLASKFTVAYLPALALGTLFLVVNAAISPQTASALPYNWVALIFSVGTLCAVYLTFGAAGANVNWEDPRHVTRGTMGCLGWMAGSLSVWLIAGLFIGIPPVLTWLQLPEVLAQLVGLGIGVLASLLVSVGALLWARSRVVFIGEG